MSERHACRLRPCPSQKPCGRPFARHVEECRHDSTPSGEVGARASDAHDKSRKVTTPERRLISRHEAVAYSLALHIKFHQPLPSPFTMTARHHYHRYMNSCQESRLSFWQEGRRMIELEPRQMDRRERKTALPREALLYT